MRARWWGWPLHWVPNLDCMQSDLFAELGCSETSPSTWMGGGKRKEGREKGKKKPKKGSLLSSFFFSFFLFWLKEKKKNNQFAADSLEKAFFYSLCVSPIFLFSSCHCVPHQTPLTSLRATRRLVWFFSFLLSLPTFLHS